MKYPNSSWPKKSLVNYMNMKLKSRGVGVYGTWHFHSIKKCFTSRKRKVVHLVRTKYPLYKRVKRPDG